MKIIIFFQLILISNGYLLSQGGKEIIHSVDTVFNKRKISKIVLLDTMEWLKKSSKDGVYFFQHANLDLTMGFFFVDKKEEINGVKVKNKISVDNYVEIYCTQYISQLNKDNTTLNGKLEFDVDGRIIKVYQELLNPNFIVTATFINDEKQSFCMVFTGSKEEKSIILKKIDEILIKIYPLSPDIKDDWTRIR